MASEPLALNIEGGRHFSWTTPPHLVVGTYDPHQVRTRLVIFHVAGRFFLPFFLRSQPLTSGGSHKEGGTNSTHPPRLTAGAEEFRPCRETELALFFA